MHIVRPRLATRAAVVQTHMHGRLQDSSMENLPIQLWRSDLPSAVDYVASILPDTSFKPLREALAELCYESSNPELDSNRSCGALKTILYSVRKEHTIITTIPHTDNCPSYKHVSLC